MIPHEAHHLDDPAGQLRYVPRMRATTAALLAGAVADEEATRRLAGDRLAGLREALWASPGWRQRLQRAGGSPHDLASLADLAAVPPISRAELALSVRDLAVVVPGDPELAFWFVARSSGTTGQPVGVLRDRYDGLHRWSVLDFHVQRLRLGELVAPKVAFWCSLPGGFEVQARVPAFFGGELRRISATRPGAWARLQAYGPELVTTNPEGLSLLTDHLEETPGALPLKMVQTTARHLPVSLLQRFAAVCPAAVVDEYATTETGPVAWACGAAPGRYHVLAPDVWVESVMGRLTITRLRPSPLPLVRYQPGDHGEVDFGPCSCGFRGQSLWLRDGRGRCDWTTPSGAVVDPWSLAPLFKRRPLDAFRMVHEGGVAFRVEIASGEGLSEGDVTDLSRALEYLGFMAPNVRVVAGTVDHHDKPAPFASETTIR